MLQNAQAILMCYIWMSYCSPYRYSGPSEVHLYAIYGYWPVWGSNWSKLINACCHYSLEITTALRVKFLIC